MINNFLATLDNNPEAPSGFVWPEFEARTIDSAEASARAVLIGISISREDHFVRCLQLVDLVAESPVANYLTAKDDRITYTRTSIRERLAVSGLVVQYTGPNSDVSSVNLIVNSSTPDAGQWALDLVTASQAHVVDGIGREVTQTFSFDAGISDEILLPGNAGSIRLYGNDPQANDSWNVSFRRPGISWIQQVLANIEHIDTASILSPELFALYIKYPLALDRLAVLIVGLADK